MKRTAFIYLFGLVALIAFYACKPNDRELEKNVQSVLVSYPGVHSSVSNAVATLTGTVASEELKAGAERAVRSVKHITSVTNDITINAPAPITSSKVVVSSDDVLNQSIRESLDDAGYNNVNINIVDGEVTLTGKVKRDDLQRVMQITNDASPRRVINQLEIE